MSPSIRHLRILLCLAAAMAGAQLLAAEGAASAPSATQQRFTVIELPATTAPGFGRPRSHHALSIATDAPKPLLRSLGLDATDCAVRFRLPSRITPSRESSTGMRLDVQAQAGLGCRF